MAIRTDLQTSPPTYAGEAFITLDVKDDTSSLVFHAGTNLSITHIGIASTDLKSTSTQLVPLSALSYDETTEVATLKLEQSLKAGSKGVKLWFRFESELEKSMHGYYTSEGDLNEKTGEKAM